MHEREQSDPAIGAGKPTNKAEVSFVAEAAEPVEQRAGAKGNACGQKHAPDTEPGARVTGARARTEGFASPSPPKVGAVCLNWARTDLCGGRGVTCVPTAILFTQDLCQHARVVRAAGSRTATASLP